MRIHPSLWCEKNARLNIATLAHVDSCGSYNIAPLLLADYAVVVTPFQFHQGVEKQKIMKSLYDVFAEKWEISKDFEKLPEEYALGKGIKGLIYHRVRPTTTATALATFRAMQRKVVVRPGSQVDWLVLSSAGLGQAWQLEETFYSVRALPAQKGKQPKPAFLYIGKVPAHGELTGVIKVPDKLCPAVMAELSTIDERGGMKLASTKEYAGGQATRFTLPFSGGASENLLLEFSLPKAGSNEFCFTELTKLAINPTNLASRPRPQNLGK